VKKFALFSFLLLCEFLKAHTVVTFQPDSVCGKDALVISLWPNTNYGSHPDFLACTWTNQGNPSTARALIEFDLNTIPPGAVILNATLELFHYASPMNTGHSNLSGPANAWLERITQPWNENTVTWSNQPATSAVNQINVPAPTSMTQNYSINVITLVNDILNDPANSFGFELRMQNESYYRSLLFASSDMSNPSLRPKLTITYDLNIPPLSGCYTNFVITQTGGPATPSVDPIVHIPNVFTPNGDGINDTFFADSVNYLVDEFIIYDRWGAVVYDSRPGAPWNGTHNGKPCSDGTYYYIFGYTVGSEKHAVKGFVTLIR
jgi:gliding motility-associated-like protein